MKQFFYSNFKPAIWFYGLLFLILVIIDQVFKKTFLNVDNQFSFLRFHSVENSELIFNLDFSKSINFLIIVFALLFFCWQFYKNFYQRKICVLFSYLLIIAGASSNIVDRIFFGVVRDFINIGLGFTFNFADVYIFVGIFLLLFKPSINSK